MLRINVGDLGLEESAWSIRNDIMVSNPFTYQQFVSLFFRHFPGQQWSALKALSAIHLIVWIMCVDSFNNCFLICCQKACHRNEGQRAIDWLSYLQTMKTFRKKISYYSGNKSQLRHSAPLGGDRLQKETSFWGLFGREPWWWNRRNTNFASRCKTCFPE